MNARLRPLALVLAALMAGCNTGPANGLNLAGERDPAIDRLGPWYYTGIEDTRRAVVTSPDAWDAAWRELFAHQTPQPEVPPVDFGRDMVVLVAMGTRSSGGYDITVDDVTGTDGVIRVRVTETSPGTGCGVTLALTQPAAAVIVHDARGAAVQFEERQAVRHCG